MWKERPRFDRCSEMYLDKSRECCINTDCRWNRVHGWRPKLLVRRSCRTLYISRKVPDFSALELEGHVLTGRHLYQPGISISAVQLSSTEQVRVHNCAMRSTGTEGRRRWKNRDAFGRKAWLDLEEST